MIADLILAIMGGFTGFILGTILAERSMQDRKRKYYGEQNDRPD